LPAELDAQNEAEALRTDADSLERVPLDRKKNGIFYTPTRATQILANWAIQTREDSVLEPSFGGCGFLAAVLDRLRTLGRVLPEELVCGSDVDPDAFVFLGKLLTGDFPDHRFLRSDFLALTNSDFPTRAFTVVIGNPPYVSLHNMEEEQRSTAVRLSEVAGVNLSRKASLWAYFLIHSLSFLDVNGRMAWILPGSFVHADYSAKVRDVLQSSFRRCLAVQLEERLFIAEGTEENSVVLLCEGYGSSQTAEIELARAKDLNDLELTVAAWVAGKRAGVKWEGRASLALLPEPTRTVWDDIRSRGQTRSLGAFLKVRIGIVTGANKFFVLSEQNANAHSIPPECLQPIIGKFAHCRGLVVSDVDLLRNREAGFRCLLVDTRGEIEAKRSLVDYLNSYPKIYKEQNQTFAKRSTWHLAHDGIRPDGFLSCMQGDGPTLVLNDTGVTCTNTVHRIFFESGVDNCTQKFLALSLQGTFAQLSAELEGRSYGSGGLKLEPSEAARILVFEPEISDPDIVDLAFSRADELIRSGDRSGARAVADELHVRLGFLSPEEIRSMNNALTQLRESRRGSRTEKANV
jgi:adenine-specific DNA methylase